MYGIHLFTFIDRFDHVCEQCGWKFQSKGNLKGHLASTHRTEKNFKCEQCQRRYMKTICSIRNFHLSASELQLQDNASFEKPCHNAR